MSAAPWAGVAERGSTIGLWITVLVYRVLGRRLSTVLVTAAHPSSTTGGVLVIHG